jgi:hypothetical protein
VTVCCASHTSAASVPGSDWPVSALPRAVHPRFGLSGGGQEDDGLGIGLRRELGGEEGGETGEQVLAGDQGESLGDGLVCGDIGVGDGGDVLVGRAEGRSSHLHEEISQLQNQVQGLFAS